MKIVKTAYEKARISVFDFGKNDIVTTSNGFTGEAQPFRAMKKSSLDTVED